VPIELTPTFWVLVLSEVVALWIIWMLWRSADHLFFKVALTIVALIPILGPIIALWIGNFPSKAPPILRDQLRYRTDFYDRWRDVLNAPGPKSRFQRWRTLMTKHRNEDP